MFHRRQLCIEKLSFSSFNTGVDFLKELALYASVSYNLEPLNRNVTLQTMTHFDETEAIYIPS